MSETMKIHQTDPQHAVEVFTDEGRGAWVMRLSPNGEITFNLDEMTADDAAMVVVEKIQQYSIGCVKHCTACGTELFCPCQGSQT